MRCLRESNSQHVVLAARLGGGGEADIYQVDGQPDLVAKIYHSVGPERWAKLAAMVSSPPDDPTRPAHTSIAWPVDRLSHPSNRNGVGFLMPRAADALPVFQYYSSGSRKKHCPGFTYEYLLATAHNIASAVNAIHNRGYVVGDINESNILVNDRALATLVDTDSFQVSHSSRVYRCTVGKPEYTPPELQGVDFSRVDRTPEHDRFGLAVLVFQLLMEGVHPFDGRYAGAGDPPPLEERIRGGWFPHGTRLSSFTPAVFAVPSTLLDPDLLNLFRQCFEAAHTSPSHRPPASQWRDSLDAARKRLNTCTTNARHRYGGHLSDCPWCDRTRLLKGRDPFPSPADVSAGRHLRPVPTVRTVPSPLPPGPQPTRPTATPPRPARNWRTPLTWVGAGLAILALVILLARIIPSLLPTKPESTVSVAPLPVAPLPIDIKTRTNPRDAQVAVWIPPGQFTMGCSPDDSQCDNDEKPAHTVKITKGFWLGQTEVTQSAYQKLTGTNPSNFKGDNLPVEQVDWNAANSYCQKAGGRLPTEAEWEYAARAGTTGATYGALDTIAWHTSNSGSRTHPVKTKLPNRYGLYDMIGNVWEWTADRFGGYQSGEIADPKGSSSGDQRVLRGGGWTLNTWSARASYRGSYQPDDRNFNLGFRCAWEQIP